MGAELTEGEAALASCYESLKRALEEHDDLPPFARRNGLKALASLWQVANGLDLAPGQLYDAGA